MKRDMDQVREMLLRVEGEEQDFITTERGSAELHHLWLLLDAGFISSGMRECPTTVSGGIEHWESPRLTWEGAEFLDGIRDESRWAKVKGAIAAKGWDVAVSTIKPAVAALVKQAFGA